MNPTFSAIKTVIRIIAWLVFSSACALTLIGGYDFVMIFYNLATGSPNYTPALMAIDLLHAVDVFLVAIVIFVLAIGILILFDRPESQVALRLPEWLRVKNFMELKAILWEAILTTLVVSYLAGLAEKEIAGEQVSLPSLIVPGSILLIALSLFFLKRAEK